tara:strand:- start:12 stop:599 length:588 start_codon:yes stop_codon:yes gene_type:complete
MSTYEASRYAFPTSAITSGTFADARLAASNVTQHVSLAPTTGTWTIAPSRGSFAAGTNGKYQKVGQVCYFQAHYQWSTAPWVTGEGSALLHANFYFDGLPFTSVSVGTEWFVGEFKVAGYSVSTNPANWTGLVTQNTDRLYFCENGSGNADNVLSNYTTSDHIFSVSNYEMTSYLGISTNVNSYWYVSGWYITAS